MIAVYYKVVPQPHLKLTQRQTAETLVEALNVEMHVVGIEAQTNSLHAVDPKKFCWLGFAQY